MRKLSKWVWGFFFLCAAAALVIYPLTGFTTIALPTVIITIFLIPVFILSLMKLNFFGVFFSVAIALIMYAGPLGFVGLNPWLVLVAALFATIGCSIIFKNAIKKHFTDRWDSKHHEEGFDTIENMDGSVINSNTSFCGAVKYLHSEDLQRANLSCSFGALKAYFDNCTVHPNGAVIYVDASFCGVELFLPKNWRVVNNIQTSLGGVEIKSDFPVKEGPVVTIAGKASFSGVTIRAIY